MLYIEKNKKKYEKEEKKKRKTKIKQQKTKNITNFKKGNKKQQKRRTGIWCLYICDAWDEAILNSSRVAARLCMTHPRAQHTLEPNLRENYTMKKGTTK